HWRLVIDAAEWAGIQVSLAPLLCVSFAAIVCRQLFTFWRAKLNSTIVFWSIHRLREFAFNLFLKAQTGLQQEASLGEAVNDVAVELPKAIKALYGTVDFVSKLLLLSVYVFGLLFLSVWMTIVSLSVTILAVGMLGVFIRQSRSTSADITR